MKTVFLSYQFNDADHELVSQVERLLESHRLEVVTGRRLGGNELTPEIERRILQSDSLIALCTRRERNGGSWTTSHWVKKEYAIARKGKKPCIAVFEEGVQRDRGLDKREYLTMGRASTAETLLALSETVARWKQVPIKALVLPPEISELVAEHGSAVHCRYRLMLDGRSSEWRRAEIIGEPGGAYAYLQADNAQQMVQVEVKYKKERWCSAFTQQWIHIQLAERGA